MSIENIAELDYEAAQSEKRDKLNARLQIWSVFVALVGGFGLASLQSSSISYVVALFPLLAVCVARYTAHSEMVLDQIKAYILKVEQDSGYSGYESFNRSNKRLSSGGHKKALRDALLLTELLATVVIIARLVSMPIIAAVVLIVELSAIIATAVFLRDK